MCCTTCGNSPIENDGLCATCRHSIRKAERMKVAEPRILKKMSHKMTGQLSQYTKKKARWIKGKKCQARFTHECTGELTIHHMAGRVGFYDEWATENGMPLLIDERLWMPLCLNAHQFVEEHPTFAKQNGYSEYRLTNKK